MTETQATEGKKDGGCNAVKPGSPCIEVSKSDQITVCSFPGCGCISQNGQECTNGKCEPMDERGERFTVRIIADETGQKFMCCEPVLDRRPSPLIDAELATAALNLRRMADAIEPGFNPQKWLAERGL